MSTRLDDSKAYSIGNEIRSKLNSFILEFISNFTNYELDIS